MSANVWVNVLGAGHHQIVSKLVTSGKVDVNAVNGRGESALHKVRLSPRAHASFLFVT